MKSATIRLNNFEVSLLYDALQVAPAKMVDETRKKVQHLSQKLGNVLRRTRVKSGVVIPVKKHVPKRRPLKIDHNIHLLEPRHVDPPFRQPK